MFVSRYLRINKFGLSLLRPSRLSGNLRANALYLYKYNDTYSKLNYNLFATRAIIKCWNCQTILNDKPCLFCKNCSLIQSSEQQDINYFDLFNIYEQYEIDTEQLTLEFRKLQNLIHPDKFSNKTEVSLCYEIFMFV